MNEHDGEKENVKFDWKITGKQDKPVPRQILEALAIDKKTEKENLNSKKEFHGQSINRIRIDKSSDSFVCNQCGYILEDNLIFGTQPTKILKDLNQN